MKEIKISSKKEEKIILLDDIDYNRLKEYNWSINQTGYAIANVDGQTITMHKFILGEPPVGYIIDHKDKNRLNNTRENLRFCTFQQNSWNKKKKLNCTSKYKGVSFNNKTKKWHATITKNGIYHYIGSFNSEEIAAKHYDYQALKFFKEFSNLNFPNYDYFNFEEKQDKEYSSKYERVSYDKLRNKWIVYLKYKNKNYGVGSFATELEAAQHDDYINFLLFDKKFKLNFPDIDYSEFKPKYLSKSIINLIKKTKNIELKHSSGTVYNNISYSNNKWHIELRYNNKRYNLGYYQSDIEAAQHRDYIHWHLFQNKKELNFPEIDYTLFKPTKLNHNCFKLLFEK